MQSSEKQQTLTKFSWDDELLRPGKRWSLGGEARDFEKCRAAGEHHGEGLSKYMENHEKVREKKHGKTSQDHGQPWRKTMEHNKQNGVKPRKNMEQK